MEHGFLTIISRQQFQELLRGFAPLETETVGLDHVVGRVLARDLEAGHDWPLENRSCMDGFAVRTRDLFGATETNPGYLECTATLTVDQTPDFTLASGDCARIATGGVLPQGADGVVMVEHTGEMGGTTVEFRKSVAPWEHVMHRGEDAEAGKTLLAAGTVFRPQEMGLCAALGVLDIPVGRVPRVGILSTGDELIKVTETPRPGQVRDVNSHTLAALAALAGAAPTKYGIVPDDMDSLAKGLDLAIAENDVVLLSGGSSIGVRDLTIELLEHRPDTELLAHGVAMAPGKPTILARTGNKPILGLPGQVTSALVVVHVLVLPLLRHLQGDPLAFAPDRRPMRQARLARNVASKPGREDYVRVRLEPAAKGGLEAIPVLGKSGLLRTMVTSHGLMTIPADSEGLYAGSMVDVWLV